MIMLNIWNNKNLLCLKKWDKDNKKDKRFNYKGHNNSNKHNKWEIWLKNKEFHKKFNNLGKKDKNNTKKRLKNLKMFNNF